MRWRFITALIVMVVGSHLTLSAQMYAEDYDMHRYMQHRRHMNAIYSVMGGVALPQVWEANEKISTDSRAGFQVGFAWGLDFGRVELVPEFWCRHNRSGVEVSDIGISGDMVTNTFEVPIICAVELGAGFRFNVGTSLSMMNNCTIESSEGDLYEVTRANSTAGYLVGLSATLTNRMIFDIRYTGRFRSVESSIYMDGVEEGSLYELNSSNFSFNIGYRF